MFTPETSSEIWKSDWVTCRAHPPSGMRLCARLNDAQNIGMPLTSVGGGLPAAGIWRARVGFWGPGSASALGLVTLTAPSGGRSGLPSCAALAAAEIAVVAPTIVVAAKMLRRENSRIPVSV